MPNNVLSRGPVTNAFLTMLRNGTGKQIGDGRLLDAPSTNEPWAVLYVIPGGSVEGPMGDPFADLDVVYQVTSFGKTREQTEWMQDRVRLTVLKRSTTGGWAVPLIDATGWSVIGRLLEEPIGGIEPSGTAPNLTFTAVDRFRVRVTPH